MHTCPPAGQLFADDVRGHGCSRVAGRPDLERGRPHEPAPLRRSREMCGDALGCRGRPLTPFGAPVLAASVPNVVSVRRCHGRRPDGRDHCGARGAEALQRPSRRRLDREVRQARRQRRNLCALAPTLTPPRTALPRIVQTRSYRELLDRWQLWQERAAFDVAARRLYGPGAADTQSGPPLMLT